MLEPLAVVVLEKSNIIYLKTHLNSTEGKWCNWQTHHLVQVETWVQFPTCPNFLDNKYYYFRGFAAPYMFHNNYMNQN